MDTRTLNNGIVVPQVGLGVYKVTDDEAERVVSDALAVGYRLIDTAALYRNERGVGNAIRKSGIPRKDIFVTTKLFPATVLNVEGAFEASLERLGLDYVDLYLVHWPFLFKKNTWKTMEKIYRSGRAKSIGVSNFRVSDLQAIEKTAEILPAVNQVEFHPFLYRKELLDYCRARGITLEAHSPLTHGQRLQDPRITAVAQRYNKTNAQVMIRWSIQHGLLVIPKTTRAERMRENISVFDFQLRDADMTILDNIHEGAHLSGISRVLGE